MNYALLAALKESASTRRGKAEAKELPFVSTFLFSSGEEGGVLLTKRRPFLSQALSNPTAREMLLHYVQVYLALSRRKFKFDVFKVQVSAAKFEQEK